MDENGYYSLTGLAHAYRSGGAKPSTVVEAHLDRIARLNPKLEAYQSIYADDALKQAEAADRLFAAGYSAHPFQGIPFALKDICDVEGRVTTGGSKAMLDRVSPSTATIALRLLSAGGILLGKTKTVECALGGWGTNQHMGTPWNPWDTQTHRVPGGSSSGTGVAVASGMAVCGVGTDTGGSVRLPSAFCGLVGLKVTEGQLPTTGILPLSHTLDTPGPMARSVVDAALMYETMRGVEGLDLAARYDQPPAVAGMRFGILSSGERDACAANILEHYDTALEVLRSLGVTLVPFIPPRPYQDVLDACGRIITAEGWHHHGALYTNNDLPLDEDVRTRMLGGRDVTASAYLGMLEERKMAKLAFLDSMTGLDAVLTPTTTRNAPRVIDVDQTDLPGHYTRPGNYYGLCALSLPMDVAENGLPTSLQIMARPNAEHTALHIGAAYESARGAFATPDVG